MNGRKFLQVLLTVAALGALGVWSYSSAPAASPRGAGAGPKVTAKPGTTPTSTKKKNKNKNAHPTTVPSGPTTTVARNPEAYAKALFDDWAHRDRDNASRVAAPDVVSQLFAHAWHATDGWVAQGCTGSAGSTYCTWTHPHRHYIFQVRDATGGLPILVVALQRTS